MGRKACPVGRFLDLDRQVEHREDLPPPRDRRLGFGVDLRQVLEHAEEHVTEEQEGRHRAEPEPPFRAEQRPTATTTDSVSA